MDLQSVVPAIIALLAGWLIGYLAMRGPKNAERAKSEALEKELEETQSSARGLDEKLRASEKELVAERTRTETLHSEVARLEREVSNKTDLLQKIDKRINEYNLEIGELRTALKNEQENSAEKLRLV